MWKLGMNLTAGKFLFLGDYVDRGQLGLECLAYLFSLKVRRSRRGIKTRRIAGAEFPTYAVNVCLLNMLRRMFLYRHAPVVGLFIRCMTRM